MLPNNESQPTSWNCLSLDPPLWGRGKEAQSDPTRNPAYRLEQGGPEFEPRTSGRQEHYLIELLVLGVARSLCCTEQHRQGRVTKQGRRRETEIYRNLKVD